MAGGEGRSATVEEINHLHAALTDMFRGAFRSDEAKGPAETAISPSHGPTNPHEEKAMDVRSDTTDAAAAARSETPARALMGMEDVVWNAALAAELADYVAAQMIGDIDRTTGAQITAFEADLLLFATTQAKQAADAAREAFKRIYQTVHAMEAA